MESSEEGLSLDPSGTVLIISTAFFISAGLLQAIRAAKCFDLSRWLDVGTNNTPDSHSDTSAEGAKMSWWHVILNTETARRLLNHQLGMMGRTYRKTFAFLSFNYLSRLYFCLCCFAVTHYLSSLASVCAGWRTPNIRLVDKTDSKPLEGKRLPDLGHDSLQLIEWLAGSAALQMLRPYYFLAPAGWMTFILIISHPKRLLLIRRVLAIYAYIEFLRAVCVTITSLPDSSAVCAAQFGADQGAYKARQMFPAAFSRALKLMFFPSHVTTCGSMVFSGHTVMLVLSFLVFHTYLRAEECNTALFKVLPTWLWPLLRWVVFVIVVLGIYAVIATKVHYTLDVLIAIYISEHAFTQYHWLASKVRQGNTHTLHPTIRGLFNWLEAEEIQKLDDRLYSLASLSPPITPLTPMPAGSPLFYLSMQQHHREQMQPAAAPSFLEELEGFSVGVRAVDATTPGRSDRPTGNSTAGVAGSGSAVSAAGEQGGPKKRQGKRKTRKTRTAQIS